MAFPSRASLDAAPLLEAQVEQKGSGASSRSISSKAMEVLNIFTRKLTYRSITTTLRPSFLQPTTGSPKPQHPTAWLDGLRGFASFFVFLYHYQHLFHKAFNMGYGGNKGRNDHWIIQLPIIRLIFTGGPMVSIFWVLSGVSLSLKPIQLARAQNWDKFFDTLFSSVFRRAMRLYMPVMFVQTCVLIMTLMGMFNHAFALSQDWPFSGTNEKMHVVKDTNYEQIKDWVTVMWAFLNPFRPFRPGYDPHLWTIPFEFRNSIILFATLVGFSKLRAKIRIGLTIALWAYCMMVNEGDVALFIAGMGIAEYMLIQDENSQQLPSGEKTDNQPSRRARAAWATVAIIGLHLLSFPAWNKEHALGYETLTNITPAIFNSAELTWGRLGAALFVLALCSSAELRRPFQTPFAIYMGKISFPLYIVHGPVNHTLGLVLVESAFLLTGRDTFVGYETGVIVSFVPLAIVVVWLADLLMRTIDIPSVRFGRTLQNRWAVAAVQQRGRPI
ncbi:hypothetical protein K504DRAFT_420166 [Pleomassaria siparia CBS 279.74]|uniref:Acyltransferase 3 domain-containing protein n=1 Tax=Pleomassaria siparia CBS 279.74 TaxID=1314801 RepID=A0A6G1KNF7_9PLEO|nr:hypothetical protein K504DRAFT_420166 [Pleomassaria siparia CBS 279.74]